MWSKCFSVGEIRQDWTTGLLVPRHEVNIFLLFVSECTWYTHLILTQSNPNHCLLSPEWPGVLIGLVIVPCKWASTTFLLTVFMDEVGKCKSKEELVSMWVMVREELFSPLWSAWTSWMLFLVPLSLVHVSRPISAPFGRLWVNRRWRSRQKNMLLVLEYPSLA